MPRIIAAPSIRYSNTYKRYDLIWVQFHRYPWWPAILIEEEDLLEDEVILEAKPGQKMVQFFDDPTTFCAVDTKYIRPFFEFLKYFCTEDTPADIKRAVHEAQVYHDVVRLRLKEVGAESAEPARNATENAIGKREKKQKTTPGRKKRRFEDTLEGTDQRNAREQPALKNKRRNVGQNAASSSRDTAQVNQSIGNQQLKSGFTSNKAELNRKTERGDKRDRSRSRACAFTRGKCLEVLKNVIVVSPDTEDEIGMDEEEAQKRAEAIERCLIPTWEEDPFGYYCSALKVAKTVSKASYVPRPQEAPDFVRKHLRED